ncbi:MAG: virulence RhuM family protein [Puniceicoccales bacterium]|nr:virulence RhuM family protein [Puniceicoccales bacterium]
MRLQDETVWLTQQGMAMLFQTTKQNINQHVTTIYAEGELAESATVKKYLTVRQEGRRQVQRELEYYNIDVIISVGYRVKSAVATKFRIWATQRLREFIVKGHTIDADRLKEAGNLRYFEELLAKIRDIRSSEKIFWRKVLDIFATSVDYNPNDNLAQEFFKRIQNQMHWAAHGHTAAEIIFGRADASKPLMGITNFSGTKLLRRDVEVAKNYLDEAELAVLNRIVTAYLEVAELQASSHKVMTMRDWTTQMHGFLTMTGREILNHAGRVSHEQAIEKAHHEYAIYQKQLLAQPTPVEKDFVALIEGVKKEK